MFLSGSAVVVGAARHQPFLSLAVPTCSFPEPLPPARAAIKGPSALVLGGSEVVAKGLCPYPHVLVALLRLYSEITTGSHEEDEDVGNTMGLPSRPFLFLSW